MAESRRFSLTPQLDIQQILQEAQHRWLRPAEICEILQNYRKFRIAPEAPNKPPNGSLFLFDRKVLRYFRKDGHNWRKKKDGKTVKEAHERLKSGSVDVLHCYYAHGEDNENFQRRSYWMLEEEYMHIVLVHYREVKNNKASYISSRDAEDNAQVAYMDSPACSGSFTTQKQLPQITDAGSPISPQTSEYDDAESDNYQANSRYHSFVEMRQYGDGPVRDTHLSNSYAPIPSINDQSNYHRTQVTTPESTLYSRSQEDETRVFDETGLGLEVNRSSTQFGLTSWEEVLDHCTTESQSMPFDPTVASIQAVTQAVMLDNPQQYSSTIEGYFSNDMGLNQEGIASSLGKPVWQLLNAEVCSPGISDVDVGGDLSIEGNPAYASLLKQLSLDLSSTGDNGLKKYDSFNKWVSTELDAVDDSQLQSTSGDVYWSTIESDGDVTSLSNQEQDSYLVSPSISQEQLFSIVDFFPSWASTGMETKVLITGTFLMGKEEVKKCDWSCMFGEIEVPADILASGTLCCRAPPHKAGRVPFYITCSNRLACSEVREFEYRDFHGIGVNEMDLYMRLEKILSMDSVKQSKQASTIIGDRQHLISEINSLMMEVDDEWFNVLTPQHEEVAYSDSAQDLMLQKFLKDKLHAWLLYKVAEDGKGPSVLDEEGQGVLHLAAALGYDWAITPTVTAGVNVNFRDVHGWTALHWAAFYGRERTVATLIGLGAAAGALTDPSPEFPSGRTPADLASSSGHKGIAGFLAESSLTSHLILLTLKDSKSGNLAEVCGVSGIGDVAARSSFQPADEDLSLKDSLSAVQNAAQAASRIHQVFRVQSFHRKKLVEYSDDKSGISDERALSLISHKASKLRQRDLPVHVAATRIQNKFRGWKGRKEFLIIRQRIVKIQAHIRGHQVRKHYKKIIWTVLVVEKAILRWRRKGSGLRGFRSEGMVEGPSVQNQQPKEDDYDFLKEGRKQTEVRLEKALARVKSMVQYPEARDQYRRLLNVATQLQEPKEGVMHDVDEARDMDLMTELLEEDNTFMPLM